MDATTQAFVTEIVSRKIAENWLYWLLYLAAVFVAAYFSAYIKKRAENLATKADFDDLKDQLKQTTRLTEEIKNEVGHLEWRARESNSAKRAALEKLVRSSALAFEQMYPALRDISLGEDISAPAEDNILEIEMLATLYFQDLVPLVDDLSGAMRELVVFALQRREELRQLAGDERLALRQATPSVMGQHFVTIRQKRGALNHMAAELMQSLLDPPE